jgi:hypothetical protein
MASTRTTDHQTEVYKRLLPRQRLEEACKLYRFAQEIIRNRIRREHPEYDGEAIEKQVRSFF